MAGSEKDIDGMKAELWQSRANLKKLMPQFLVQVGLAVATTCAIFYGGYYHCPAIPTPASDDVGSRAVYTVRCAFPPLLVLIAAIQMVGMKRLSTPALNPLAGKEHYVRVQQRFLVNTMEQLMVWLLSTAVLVTYLSLEEMRLVPLYSTCFVVGRILFSIGYSIGPMKRSLGMWTNFLSVAFVVGLTIYFMFTRSCASAIESVSQESSEKIEL